MPLRDTVSWTVVISGFAQKRLHDEAVGLFYEIFREGGIVKPNWVGSSLF